jgi:geranylgeranyl pyrophosphate synthase
MSNSTHIPEKSKALTEFTQEVLPEFEKALTAYLTAEFPFAPQNRLLSAITYSCLTPSKRYRPLLIIASQKLFSNTIHPILPFASAVEMIHTYSLIHDDLPAMDDDVLRRGKPTCHIQFDEATAILAGDALQCIAFEILATDLPIHFKADKCQKAIAYLGKKLGIDGTTGGQQMDLDMTASTDLPSKDYLAHMHHLKTGALIKSCVVIPAILNNASATIITHLTQFSTHLGLLFQIADDILDETSNTEKLGKTAGKDDSQKKLTYTRQFGLATAQEMAKAEALNAQEVLKKLTALQLDTALLATLIEYTLNRTS